MKPAHSVILVLAAATLNACGGSDPASYEQRMAYLRKVANRGVKTHNLLASQTAKIDAKRCADAYSGLADLDVPSDLYNDTVSKEWAAQVKQFFVDSCVSGLPKPVPGQPAPSPASTSPTATPSPSKT